MTSDPPKPARTWTPAVICLLLSALVFAVFGQTARFDFVNLDDLAYVSASPVISRGISLAGMKWSFTHVHAGLWHPLTVMLLMLDARMFGSWPGGYHLVNVALHAVSAVLLFLLLREITGGVWRSAFVAAVFAIHPLRAESVVWVTECKDVLSGVFFMLTLWAYVRYARESRASAWYVLLLVAFALGLMSKSMLVTTPCVLLLLDYWPLGRLQRISQAPALLLEKVPLFLLSALSSLATVMAVRSGNHAAVTTYPANAPIAYSTYLTKLLFPAGLALPYPIPEHGWPSWEVGLSILLLAAITIICIVRRDQPYLLIGWLWYVGMLVPVAGVMQTDYHQPYADRFTYLPQIGLCIAITWEAAEFARRIHFSPAMMGAIAALIIGALSVMSYRQTSYWRNSIALWTHTIDHTQDNGYAHYLLGNALLRLERNEEAAEEFREALRIDPSDKETYVDLATVLLREGRIDDAITQYRVALKIDPGNGSLHYRLGRALLHRGNLDEAAVEVRRAVQIDPAAFSGALGDLGGAFLQRGRPEEGIAACREAVGINPANPVAQTNLGNALYHNGKPEEGIAHLQKALDLQPGNAIIENYLAWMLATAPRSALRDGSKALVLASKASESAGGANPEYLRTLAAACADTADFPRAIQTANSALQLSQANSVLAAKLRADIKRYEAGLAAEDAP